MRPGPALRLTRFDELQAKARDFLLNLPDVAIDLGQLEPQAPHLTRHQPRQADPVGVAATQRAFAANDRRGAGEAAQAGMRGKRTHRAGQIASWLRRREDEPLLVRGILPPKRKESV